MKTISLNGQWKLVGYDNYSDDEIVLDATVPGEPVLELSKAGYLPADLFFGLNIEQCLKYESFSWLYEKEFELDTVEPNSYLVFGAVDCIASFTLNGNVIGTGNNAFIQQEFKVDGYLKEGKNILQVYIQSGAKAAHDTPMDIASICYSSHSGFNGTAVNIRKPPHSFGWDIMPHMISVGLWRDVQLQIRDEVYFEQIFFNTDTKGFLFVYELNCEFNDINDVVIELDGNCGDSVFYTSISRRYPHYFKSGMHRVDIDNAKLWWPYGYGNPDLYNITVNIFLRGKKVHTETHKVGLRTVELQRTDYTDGVNGCFRFLINGEEVMCKGSNWVPLDAFHSRDKDRYETALALVKDIGCNILRCWGGNVYEDDYFFDFCDANGIMVWQDFAMACNSYPETPEFIENLKNEATCIVRKLRNHPSLILWCGDNEIDGFHSNHGRDPDTNILTREVLPNVVLRNDKDRPYLTSSPYFNSAGHNDKTLIPSEAHLWGARDYYKADFYKQNKSHFISESGYHGCPALKSIEKFISPEKVWPYFDNVEWNLHSTDVNHGNGRVMLMHKQVKQLFGEVPVDAEDYILASQISQAEAKKYIIERVRVGRPNKSGIIWWNLLDGWPQMSDAVVDYFFEKKLAYFYIKRSQAPFAVICDETAGWGNVVMLCNDTLEEKHGHLKIFDGETNQILYEGEFAVGKNTVSPATKLDIFYSDKRLLIFDCDLSDGSKYQNHYITGYPPFDFSKYKKWLDIINALYL